MTITGIRRERERYAYVCFECLTLRGKDAKLLPPLKDLANVHFDVLSYLLQLNLYLTYLFIALTCAVVICS